MDNQILLERVMEYFEKSGLSYEELAEQSGLSVASLKRFFIKGDIPTLRSLLKLQRALKFKTDYVLQLWEYEIK